MANEIGILVPITLGLTLALLFGYITQKLKLSPLVGYLIAGIAIGPYVPGIAVDIEAAHQVAEIGIILLMFSVGMHFQLKDLLAVRKIALPGAIAQIVVTTIFATLVAHAYGWGWNAGIVFGVAISVASTVVLMRVLADNKVIHTPTGHVAVGWLIVEDLFTIFVLVMLPVIFGTSSSEAFLPTLGLTTIKIAALVIFILVVGQKLLPMIFSYVAKTGTRDLFTLAVFVVALGMAVGAAEFFGASMALGAFLAGMVVGQSDFSARAASEALPMRDVFAVVFFMSVGMLFNPYSLLEHWELMLATLGIVLIVKPAVAIVVVLMLKNTLKRAVAVGVALAQVGEFSFILASLGMTLGVLPKEANSAIIATAIISITLNPLLFKAVVPTCKFLSKFGIGKYRTDVSDGIPEPQDELVRVVMIGYGPVGRSITPKLLDKGLEIAVIEMNLDTVQEIHSSNTENLYSVYGDATQKEVLIHAGIENAEALVVSASMAPAKEIVEIAQFLNPSIRTYVHTTYISEAKLLCLKGATAVFSGEAAAASYLSKYLLEGLDPDSGGFTANTKSVCDDLM